MKNFNPSILFVLLILILGSIESTYGQCEDWSAPTDSTTYINFEERGDAPAPIQGCCPIIEINSFEVFASEAYSATNFIAGRTYSFSTCNGPGAGSWVPDFTIIAPSGNIDAFGLDDGDSCRITWTATETGDYILVVNEEGSCGGGSNTATENGFPALTCISTDCDTSYCLSWLEPTSGTGWTDFNDMGGAPADNGSGCEIFEITDFEVFAAEAYSIDNFVSGSNYVFSMCNGPGAGSWIPEFTIVAPSGAIDASGPGCDNQCSIVWTASESGTYLIVINELGNCGGGDNTDKSNGFPAINCLATLECDTSVMSNDTCIVGMITSSMDVVVCGDQDSINISLQGTNIPSGGGLAYGFRPGADGTGGNGTGFSITNSSPSTAFTSTVNGILTNNNLPKLSGTWIITPFTYSEAGNAANSVCDLSDEEISVFFNSDLSVEIEDLGSGMADVSVEGGSPPYTFSWSTGESGDTLVVDQSGEYTVTVTDQVGCTVVTSVNLTTSSIGFIPELEELLIGPNPSNGRFSVGIKLLSASKVDIRITDIYGRLIDQGNFRGTESNLDFDITDSVNGIYLVQIRIGDKQMVKRILKAM